MGLSKFEVVIVIVLLIILVLTGGKKLPELARGVGQSFKELKKGFRDDDDDRKDKDEKKS